MTGKSPTGRLRWGLLAAGHIANEFAQGIRQSESGELRAVAARELARAEVFAEKHEIPACYGSYEELLGDPLVDIVYISTPHASHAEWAIKAANAGKHILVEKPITMSHAQAEAVVEAARQNDVFLMEAYMYRIHPQMERLTQLVREGAIGKVRAIDINFNFSVPVATGRLVDPELAGGGILDVGGYCVSTARTVVEAALGIEVAEPIEVKAIGHLGSESHVDEYSTAVMRFPGDILATLSCGIRLEKDGALRVYGTEGQITIAHPPWIFRMRGPGDSEIGVKRYGKGSETIVVHAEKGLFTAEADYAARYIAARQTPLVSWASSLATMRALDRWREQVGMVYSRDTESGAQALPRATGKRNLRLSIPTARFHPLGKQFSRLVLEADAARGPESSMVLLDHYLAIGGSVLCPASLVDQDRAESRLGWWIEKNGLRKEVSLIANGMPAPADAALHAHEKACTPEALSRSHNESLQRLRTDFVDIYLLQCDNMDVSVGEFIDMLNQQRQKGTMLCFGASGWSQLRIDEANRYAATHGLQGFSAVRDPLDHPETRAWLMQTQLPAFACSGQGRAFSLGREEAGVAPGAAISASVGLSDGAAAWADPARGQDMHELGEGLGQRAADIALALALHQPFPTFALVAPRSIAELNRLAFASGLALTGDQRQ